MKLTLLICTIFLSSIASAKCVNFIAESEIPHAIALEPGVGAKACGGSDPCICFDGIDWESAIYSGGVLSNDATKLATKTAKDQSDKDARETAKQALVARKAARKNLDWSKIDTFAKLKTVMKEFVEDNDN